MCLFEHMPSLFILLVVSVLESCTLPSCKILTTAKSQFLNAKYYTHIPAPPQHTHGSTGQQ